jgi:hypothetical protein
MIRKIGMEAMSEVEKLEAEYRRLATKVIYDGFEGSADPADRAKLERLSEELIQRNAADFSQADQASELAAA